MRFHAVLILCLVVLIGGLAFFDYLSAASLFWPFLVVTAVLGAVLILVVWKTSGQRVYLLYLPAFLLLFVILQLVDLSPVKPFRRFYQSIEPNLNHQEVYDQLQAYFPEQGRFRRPFALLLNDRSLHFTLNPDDGRYNSEVVFVTFQDGRVKDAVYSAD